ncbi:PaaI family thioesterase [Thalassiella azotivora]
MPEPTVRNPDYEADVRASFDRQGLMATLGARLVRVEPGAVEIEVPHRAELTQQQGFLHAGVTTSAVDSACGYAAHTLMVPGSEVLSVEFKINLLAPAVGERLVARGRVVRSGRTITVCQGDAYAVTGDREVHCATMTATMMRVDAPAR